METVYFDIMECRATGWGGDIVLSSDFEDLKHARGYQEGWEAATHNRTYIVKRTLVDNELISSEKVY